MKAFYVLTALLIAVVLILGCGQSPESSNKTASAGGQKFLLSTEPLGAKNVSDVRDSSKNDEEVSVVGRIGGRKDPWVPHMAGFTIADLTMVPCNEREGDTCPTPWDYCCEDENIIAKKTLPVRFLNEQGEVINTDARELLAVKELSTVVVRGKIKRDKDSIKLIADGIYVKK